MTGIPKDDEPLEPRAKYINPDSDGLRNLAID